MSLCCQGGEAGTELAPFTQAQEPFPRGSQGSFLLHGSGQEGSIPTGALGSAWLDPEESRAVLKQGGIRHCQQQASRYSVSQRLAANSLGQRSVPSWGVEGTHACVIAPHETGIQLMAADAVTKMINEMFSF